MVPRRRPSPPPPRHYLVLCVHRLHAQRVVEHVLLLHGDGHPNDDGDEVGVGVDDDEAAYAVDLPQRDDPLEGTEGGGDQSEGGGDDDASVDNNNDDDDDDDDDDDECDFFVEGALLRTSATSRRRRSTKKAQAQAQAQAPIVKVLDAQAVTGVSRSRRGYVVVMVAVVGMGPGTRDAGDHRALQQLQPSSALSSTLPSAVHVKRHLDSMSPLARQNVSWASYVDQSQVVNNVDIDNDPAGTSDLASQMWHDLEAKGFRMLAARDTVRIDVHPAAETIQWCLALERHVAQHVLKYTDEQLRGITEPFVDPNIPIQWTKSRHKCTHRLAIVVETTASTTTTGDHQNSTKRSAAAVTVHWRVDARQSPDDDFFLDVRLNHDAHQEVVVVPDPALEGSAGTSDNGNNNRHTSAGPEEDAEAVHCDNVEGATPMNGPAPAKKRGSRRGKKRARLMLQQQQQQQQQRHLLEANGGAGSATALHQSTSPPLSRAYYKLHQVWKDYLSSSSSSSALRLPSLLTGHAVDVGASPGGWTQVLLDMGFRKVVAVDPGMVSTRVTSHPAVTHVRKKLEDAASHDLGVGATSSSSSKVSIVVCDACVLWWELLNDVLLKVLTSKINRSFQVPCVWVVTLKLPFKTLGSVSRHVKAAKAMLPAYVRELAEASYGPEAATGAGPLSITHRLVHLFANSDSERTLLITFERPRRTKS